MSCLAGSVLAAETRDSPVPGWREAVFEDRTRYRQENGTLCAESESAASALVRRVEVNLEKTPVLAWRWRAEQPLRGADAPEQSRDGDDFLARVYVVDEGFFPWQTRAINYVWTRDVPEGEHWPNPFADRAIMVAVQQGEPEPGEWQAFRRNVREDFKRFHDRDLTEVDAVALMTDTDNTGGRAAACYEPPRFTEAN